MGPCQSRLTTGLAGVLALCALVLAPGCSEPPQDSGPKTAEERTAAPPPAEAGPDATAIAENNRGVGLMGRFDYQPAVDVFQDLVRRYPQWLDVRVNLAIATLNRQKDGDEQKALEMVDRVLEKAPGNLRAHYVAGLLRLYLASPGEALAHFRKVADADPGDAYAAYYLGQCLAQQGEYEEAAEWYQRAMDMDPYLRSAYYGAFQAAQRLRQRDRARELVDAYQRLAGNPQARLAEFKYTRMGPRGEALAVNLERPVPPPPLQGPLFGEPREVATGLVPDDAPTMTVVDLDGDGTLDVFVTGVDAGNRVLTGNGDGSLTPLEAHPLAKVGGVNAALWGDYDNDGLTDVYLCRRGLNQLWRREQPGHWKEVAASTGTTGGALDTVDGLWLDADHDGDLDLFLVNADGPNELLNNDLNGRFRPLAGDRGISGGEKTGRQVLAADLDADRDVDLVVINRGAPNEVYVNDRLWAYRPAKGFEDFRNAPLLAAVAGDLDADGYPELYGVDERGALSRWRRDSGGEMRRSVLLEAPEAAPARVRLLLEDPDGDGNRDLVLVGPDTWRVLAVTGDQVTEQWRAGVAGLVSATARLFDPKAGPDVLALSRDGTLRLWPAGPGRYPHLALSLSGREDEANAMRSNASGIGARVALRRDSHWTVAGTWRNDSGPGQGLAPLSLGLGGAERADFVAIDWSDGVFQSEPGLETGKVQRVTETQRQLSSCPVLFAWDGQRYAFVSDFLGVGGIGYAVAPGEYAEPRPWENLLLPEGLPRAREGRYRLKVTEPMEETAYLDNARLVAWDLPPGWSMVLDERMGTGSPEPTGEPRFYRREVLPARVSNDRNEDVTDSLLLADGRAAPVGSVDPRFIGRLRREHVLTLEFPEPLDTWTGSPLLVADGWVEYPYSQTMFAAWQAGERYEPPSVEARDGVGRWHRVLERFGYPAGTPRRMSVPLQGLPPGTTALRLRGNMEIYWDRLAVAYAEPLPQVRRQVLAMDSARQRKTGFPRWSVAAQRHPSYDYDRRSPFWDTRYMAGWYTRLGPVEELVDNRDDAVAVIGPGEEVDLGFRPPAGEPPAGWTRRFVLETHGWAKDMDLYTRDGETVGPLPDTGKPKGARDALHARYLIRYQSGR